MNRSWIGGSIVVAGLAAALFGWQRAEGPAAEARPVAPPTPMAQAAPPPLLPPALAALPATAPSLPLSLADHAFLDRLRARFKAVVDGKHAQIKLLEQLIAYLKETYPQDWEDRLPGFLQALFPELASGLYAQYQKLRSYSDWLLQQRASLQGLSPEQRRQALWAARAAAFGADAEEIWAAQRRGEKLADTLDALDTTAGLTTPEKLGAYLAAVEETYGERAASFIANRQTEIITRFVELPSVQTELASLPEPQRNALLSELRAQLGMDPEAVQRWSSLDQIRDQAWRSGQDYMQERARILAETPEAAQAAKLRELQDRQFNEAEAEIIRNEEAAGFYRYGQTRRIGRE